MTVIGGDGQASLTWLGHSSVLVEMAGERVLLDPLGRRRCRAAGSCHAILVTHGHLDHLSRWTLKALDKGAHLVVPRGTAHLVSDLGFASVKEVEPGESFRAGRLEVTTVRTLHRPGRLLRDDRFACTGYVIAHDGVAIHHAGDVDMTDLSVFEEIGRSFRLDVTLLPIGGLLPVAYYRLRRNAWDRGVHIDPDTALELAKRLRARILVPIHWGTLTLPFGPFGPADSPMRRLLLVAASQGESGLVCRLGHGEKLLLAKY